MCRRTLIVARAVYVACCWLLGSSLSTGLASQAAAVDFQPGDMVVLAERAPLMDGSQVVRYLGRDEKATVLRTQSPWVHVELPGAAPKVRGWIEAKHLTRVPSEESSPLAQIEDRFKFFDKPLEMKGLFPPWANGQWLYTSKSWSDEEKVAFLSLLRSLGRKAPSLVTTVVEDRPLLLYRTPEIKPFIPGGYHFADHDVWLSDAWTEKALAGTVESTRRAEEILAHELTHALDSFQQYSWSPEWIRLIKPRLERVSKLFLAQTGIPRPEFPPKDEKHLPLLETLARAEGLPTAYATKDLIEALAECTSLMVTDSGYSPPPEIAFFIRTQILDVKTQPPGVRHTHRALHAFVEGDPEEGGREISLALDADSSLAHVYYIRGKSRRNKASEELILADFTRAIDLAPEVNRQFLWDRAEQYVLYRMPTDRDLEKGLADMDRYLREHPEDWLCRAQRGVFFLSCGLPHKALPEFEMAIAIDPKAHVAIINRMWAIRTMTQNLQNKDPALRLASAEGLAAAGPGLKAMSKGTMPATVFDALRKASTDDEDPRVRQAAASTLEKLEKVVKPAEPKS